MSLRYTRSLGTLAAAGLALAATRAALAADPSPAPADPAAPAAAPSGSNTRYGLFGGLDHRSIYGQYWFPEPLRADEGDVDNELRFDYFHAENRGRQFDSGSVELEKSFGLLTLEISGGYESDRVNHISEEGFTNVEFAGRYPVFQYVSPSGVFDTTVVAGLEVTVPTLSKISHDVEIVPKLWDLTRIGDHLSVQVDAGDSILIGPDERGSSTLEYDVVIGYELTKRDLPIPGILSTVPIFEVNGEYAFNHEDAGHNALLATVGARFNFDTISWLPAQPRLGVGYTFPIDKGGRDDIRYGLVLSVVFEY